jgi:nucleoid-associated protein YgaU
VFYELIAMATTDIEDSKLMGPHVADPGDPLRRHGLFAFGVLFLSCAVFGTTNCSAQDVAEAARQERARKENQQNPPKHVYSEEDLRRARILTPEDSERLQAKKKGQTLPAAEKPPEAINAQSAPAQLPLGDIARQYRKQKQTRQPQQSAEFHLPFDNPPLAVPIRPLPPPHPHPHPHPPSNRKDPFLRPLLPRPSISVPVPSLIAPSRPLVPMSRRPSSILHSITVQRGDSLWKLAQQNLGRGSWWRELLAVNPGIENPNKIEAGVQINIPTRSSVSRTTSKITIRKGDTLWKIAQTTFGRGAFWPCIARANPPLRDANQIDVGQELIVPGRCGP